MSVVALNTAGLVSALEQALKAVRMAAAPRPSDEDERLRSILAEFEALEGPARDRVGRDLLQLWDAFNDRFDGLDGYLSAHALEKNAYLTRLEGAAERIAPHRASAAGHYYHAIMLMLAYIGALSQQPPSETGRVLAERVALAINWSQMLARERSTAQQNAAKSDVDALSLWAVLPFSPRPLHTGAAPIFAHRASGRTDLCGCC